MAEKHLFALRETLDLHQRRRAADRWQEWIPPVQAVVLVMVVGKASRA